MLLAIALRNLVELSASEEDLWTKDAVLPKAFNLGRGSNLLWTTFSVCGSFYVLCLFGLEQRRSFIFLVGRPLLSINAVTIARLALDFNCRIYATCCILELVACALTFLAPNLSSLFTVLML